MPAWYVAFARMNSSADERNEPRPISAVAVTQMIVLHIRNGMRRRARSVIAPSIGDSRKMMA